jgi:NAD(P)-dependent dehydrogenase (short-subunit alcohol dehydrogenase family)
MTVIIISISSDIGRFLAQQYSIRGWKVIGTYRQKKNLKGLDVPQADVFQVDVTDKRQIGKFVAHLKRRKIRFDRVVCLTGSLRPARDFFDCDFDQWQDSVTANCLGPLRLVHGLYPLASKAARVVFFAGGGANGRSKHLSAYAISKIMLTKMTEFLDAEYPGLHVSIIGPGWTLTKIHQDVLKDAKASASKRRQTAHDLKHRTSTSLEDIDSCIEWVCRQPKKLTSGRNFSVVYDPWRGDKRQKLAAALAQDINMYKLRRNGNDLVW